MNDSKITLAIILIPLLGAFLLPILGRISQRVRNLSAFLFILLPLILSLKLFPQVIKGPGVVSMFQMFPGISFSFVIDGLSLFMAAVSSFISAVIMLYSFEYISHYDNQDEYYTMVVLFLGSMMGIIFSANLILLYIFWEITAIASWRLIGFYRGDNDTLRANKAFLVTVFGALVMLVGFIWLYQQTGSFDLAVIKSALKTGVLPDALVFLILFGILSKSATLPFQTWLPDAGVAPSPVTALLHAAVLVKIGVYVFARLFICTFSVSPIWHSVIPAIAALSAIVSGGAALLETDIKRIIAYSTISQIGFIFFGLSVGGNMAIAGALLLILVHGIGKAGLFLCAGIVEQNTKIKDITKLGGLIRTMPITAVSFLLCAFSIMGIPPFGGFFSKYLLFAGSFNSGHFIISFVFLFGAFLTILYLFRVFSLVFMGESKINSKEGSVLMVVSVSILGLLSLLSGVFISYPMFWIQQVIQQAAGVIR
ncbi:NADH-quinone oxidoreductase subunit L [bacterium]|nr:MAG: NADH-quinone oxidoreductase subunit L [bacterium]